MDAAFSPEFADRMYPTEGLTESDVGTIISDEELKEMGFYQKYKPCESCGTKRKPKLAWYSDSMPAETDLEKLVHELNNNIQGISNNWVVSGDHTKSGKPLLANDPHQSNVVPSLWHLAEMKFEMPSPYHIQGAAFPGGPSFFIGRNERLSWGITINNIDQSDLYEEKIQEADGDAYYLQGD